MPPTKGVCNDNGGVWWGPGAVDSDDQNLVGPVPLTNCCDVAVYKKNNSNDPIPHVNAQASLAIRNDHYKNVRTYTKDYDATTNACVDHQTNELFAKADVSLVIINDLVVNALDEPAFANAFMATKVINDAAVRSTGVSIAVTNAATNEPITSAWAYVEGKDKKDDADQDGICELYKMRPGIYTIRIEAEGYQTQTLTATIEQGKITELEISLNKS